jgi:hypothetical protein
VVVWKRVRESRVGPTGECLELARSVHMDVHVGLGEVPYVDVMFLGDGMIR